MGSPAKLEKLVLEYFSLWQQADVDSLMSMYDETMVYHHLQSGESISYPDLHRYLSQTFSKEGISLELKEAVYVDDNSAFLYWTQHIDSINRGRRVSADGVELILFKGDKIKCIYEFYDYQDTGIEINPYQATGTEDLQMTKLGLDEAKVDQLSGSLKRYFEEEKAYLDPNLNLASVSKALGFTRNQISYVLNRVLECTFYDFLNKHRIEFVVQMMMTEEVKSSIVDMAIAAGFNSTSGFYNAFKKHKGMTPIAYQKSVLSQ